MYAMSAAIVRAVALLKRAIDMIRSAQILRMLTWHDIALAKTTVTPVGNEGNFKKWPLPSIRAKNQLTL